MLGLNYRFMHPGGGVSRAGLPGSSGNLRALWRH